MSRKMRTKSAAFYYGSDSKVASELAGLLDRCSHVTIPFCGGMSILPHLKASHVVANDLLSRVIHFYRVVSGRCGLIAQQELFDRCDHTLSHPDEIELAKEFRNADVPTVDAAWSFWAEVAIGRKGAGGTLRQGASSSVRRTANGGGNASRITTAAQELRAWAEEFKRCEFTKEDFRDVLPEVADEPDCGLYCDPPWVGAGNEYIHKFDEADHRDLCNGLKRFEHARIVVRYGDHPLIRELYDGWSCAERESGTQAGGTAKEIWLTKN